MCIYDDDMSILLAPPTACSYEHVVYVLDGLLYTLTHWPKHLITNTHSDQSDPPKPFPPSMGSTNDDKLQSSPKRQKLEPTDDSKSIPKTGTKFFERTESVLVSLEKESNIQLSNDQFFGVDGGANLALENPELVGPPNQWGKEVESFSRPLHEEYPLANRPHLLKPFAKKEALFGGGGSGRESSVEGSKVQQEGAHRKEGRKGRKRKHVSENR